MFGFVNDMFNYEQRKVANTEIGEAVIDTAAVSDAARPYETGIQHPRYKDGSWIIVELYDTKEQAEIGHKKWVDLFSKDSLPPHLVDVNETDFAVALGGIGRGAYELCPQKK